MWFAPVTRYYFIDQLNFGLDFGSINDNNFKWVFNPVKPLAYVQFKMHFWVVILPSKRRAAQGLILYYAILNRHNDSFETGQWSPDGNFLLVVRKKMAKPPSAEYSRANVYGLMGHIYAIIEKRCRFTCRLINGASNILNISHACHQLSGN